MVLANVGSDIIKFLPEIQLGSKVTKCLSLTKPKIEFNFEEITSRWDTLFTFCPRRQNNIELHGSVKLFKGGTVAVVVAKEEDSGKVDLKGKKSRMQEERKNMMQLELVEIQLEKSNLKLKSETQTLNNLVYGMLPDFAIKQVQEGKLINKLEGDKTILACDIKGFTSLCHNCTPEAVIKMLKQLYALYDNLIEKYQLFKVIVLLE